MKLNHKILKGWGCKIIPAPLVVHKCMNPKPSLIYTVGVRPEKAPVFQFKLYTLTKIFPPFIYLLGKDDLFKINCIMKLEHTTQYNPVL